MILMSITSSNREEIRGCGRLPMRNMIFLRPWTNDHKEIRTLSGGEGREHPSWHFT
jgi:uncharacterized protein (DUF924 family)